MSLTRASRSGPSTIWGQARSSPLLDAVGLHVLRFAVMATSLQVAAVAGLSGWSRGLATNVVISVLAIVLMTRRGRWHSSGMTTVWRSRLAALALVPLAFEAITWALPAGVSDRAPGMALWALTLLLVGFNEELFSRGLVLGRLAAAYRPHLAVAITAALFGLQHLSALVLTSREAGDVLGNVALSALSGFALAAFQFRFRWLWPLILVHATADWATILATRSLPTVFILMAHAGFVAYGLLLLRGTQRREPDHQGCTAVETRSVR